MPHPVAHAMVAMDAARRIDIRRGHDRFGSVRWFRSWRRRPVRRGIQIALWAAAWTCVGVLFVNLLQLSAQMTSAVGGASASLRVRGVIGVVALIAAFAAATLLDTIWSDPRRASRVLELSRIRRAERIAHRIASSPKAAAEAPLDIRKLREFWRGELAYGPMSRLSLGLRATRLEYRLLQQVFFLAILAPHLLVSLLRSMSLGYSWIFGIVLPVVLLMALAMWAPVLRTRKRLRATLQSRQCPGCGYDLTALADGTDPGGGVLGPAVCPECGVRWPLVPPWPVTLPH